MFMYANIVFVGSTAKQRRFGNPEWCTKKPLNNAKFGIIEGFLFLPSMPNLFIAHRNYQFIEAWRKPHHSVQKFSHGYHERLYGGWENRMEK